MGTNAHDEGPERNRGFDLAARLDERERRELRRDLRPAERVGPRSRFAPDPKGGPARFDETLLNVASNNYLGLADHETVQAAAELGARTVGTGAGASRLVTGDTTLHRALERDLADCKGTERALVFSSGYAANVGTIDALDPDVVFSDEYNHASIVDGCRICGGETVVYDHCDPDALADAMADRAPDATDEDWLVVTDTVFSMDGTVAPLASLCDVAEQYGAWVMVDEAHATGVVGPEGAGVVQREGLSDHVDVQLGTLSKALASQGGYVAGDETLIAYLLNAARTFVFSTGLAPPAAASARAALDVARESGRRDRLATVADRLREGLTDAGFEVLGDSHVLPVLVGDRDDALALAAAVRERGVFAPAIRPPTVPEGTARLRVSPMATHTDEDLDQCLCAFREARREVGL